MIKVEAKETLFTGKECEAKWKNLKDRCTKHQRSGSGAPAWEHYELVKTIIGCSGSISQTIVTNIPDNSSTSAGSSTPTTVTDLFNSFYEEDEESNMVQEQDVQFVSQSTLPREPCLDQSPTVSTKRLQGSCSHAGRSKKPRTGNQIDQSIQRSLEACSSKLETLQAEKDDGHHFCQCKTQRREAFHKLGDVLYELEATSADY
ncbi:uncharacterized protein LOC135384321 [Ornithodoros turicata]|uniref:uncharacterized protein LOC135384321 n=1 Tax=Ornithodoros turicata TaxID=34597 RepID=UPI0031398D01